ncbi:MAG: NADH-quinone oxidoreductase subunit C [Gammaproteobacteria bacterium]|nr:NADH-quinone oxidoreductase subunit C [Gammaproteobacteria bacterium]
MLHTNITQFFTDKMVKSIVVNDELTIEVSRDHLSEICLALRDENQFDFSMLIDVCGVDYLHYGLSEWETEAATAKGFERGVNMAAFAHPNLSTPRFAVVLHLLSLQHNHRIRVRVWLDESDLNVPSVTEIWPAANWFEREAFDLFGIMFTNHPDLRRILTDYGFRGYPFRKDFPISGQVEVRYDAAEQRVVYGPVEIPPRILEPKVIRDDSRYLGEKI